MLKESKLSYRKFSLDQDSRHIVKYGWIMKSTEALQADNDLLIADGYPEIIFVLNGAYYKKGLNPNDEVRIISKSCVVGIQSQSVLAQRINNCQLIGLKLFPWGAYRLFGEKLNLLANKNISIEALEIPWLNELNIEIQNGNEESTIMELISKTLCNQIEQRIEDTSWKLAEVYIQSILAVDGQISVKELAQLHHLSNRHFQRKFKQYFGITPKKFINIIRFKKLYKSSVLQKKLPDSFLAFGYYDQMHFIKDFQKQLGITPSKSTTEPFLKLNEMAKINA